MTKRDVFGELMEGVAAMKTHLEGKLTLPFRKSTQNSFGARARNWVAHAPCSRASFAST
jgi:hypothetical protein